MRNFKLRTYSVRQETPENALFILSRGRNAGKPMFEPCRNCYILYCRDQMELENMYWVIYTLWKNSFFHQYLCGSVIQMLRLYEFHKVMKNWIIPSFEKLRYDDRILQELRDIYETERKITKQLELLSIYRDALIKKYYYTM